MRELKENEVGSATSKGTVLIDFGAEWCAPCKAILPMLQKMSTDYSGKMEIYSVDIDKQPDVAAQFGVMTVPTMVLLKEGKMVERMVGALTEKDFRKKVDPHVAG